jgi:hypothetical protein
MLSGRQSMNNTLKMLLKALKGVHVFEAAKTVAESEYMMTQSDKTHTDMDKAIWIEDRTIYLVKSLKAEINA